MDIRFFFFGSEVDIRFNILVISNRFVNILFIFLDKFVNILVFLKSLALILTSRFPKIIS